VSRHGVLSAFGCGFACGWRRRMLGLTPEDAGSVLVALAVAVDANTAAVEANGGFSAKVVQG